jgi:hypothetical protein
MAVRKGLSDPYGGRSRARFPWGSIILIILVYVSVGVVYLLK